MSLCKLKCSSRCLQYSRHIFLDLGVGVEKDRIRRVVMVRIARVLYMKHRIWTLLFYVVQKAITTVTEKKKINICAVHIYSAYGMVTKGQCIRASVFKRAGVSPVARCQCRKGSGHKLCEKHRSLHSVQMPFFMTIKHTHREKHL